MDDILDIILVKVLEKNVSDEEMRIFLSWFNESDENKNLFFEMKEIYDLREQEVSNDKNFDINSSWIRLRQKLHKAYLNSKVGDDDYRAKQIVKKKRILHWSIAAACSILILVSVTIFTHLKKPFDRPIAQDEIIGKTLPSESVQLIAGNEVVDLESTASIEILIEVKHR